MRYLQYIVVGNTDSAEPDDYCPYCAESRQQVVLMDTSSGRVIDRGCENCVRERNDW
jgi:hypothetical protein